MNTYIIIPHYNRYDLLQKRLWELYKHCKDDITQVLVVDDASNDEMTEGGLRWWAQFRTKTGFNVTSIRLPENIHFLRTCNFGIRHLMLGGVHDNDIIILLSNDVEIRNNFVGQITHIIGQNPKSLVGGVLLSHNTGWNEFNGKLFPYIEGWLLAMNKEGWSAAGIGFDERFSPCDYEDVDLSTAMLEIGYELVPLNNPGLHHLGGQTIGYNPEREKQTLINKEKFEKKWCSGNG